MVGGAGVGHGFVGIAAQLGGIQASHCERDFEAFSEREQRGPSVQAYM